RVAEHPVGTRGPACAMPTLPAILVARVPRFGAVGRVNRVGPRPAMPIEQTVAVCKVVVHLDCELDVEAVSRSVEPKAARIQKVAKIEVVRDRKSTRLNSSHVAISY